jgi:hypothetical protein
MSPPAGLGLAIMKLFHSTSYIIPAALQAAMDDPTGYQEPGKGVVAVSIRTDSVAGTV